MLIGKLAASTGVTIQAIRYYERLGLLRTAPRTKAGYRVYDHNHVRCLTFIRRSRELGFSLDCVRSLLELWESNCDCAAKKLSLRQLEIVRGKIADLKKLEKALKTMTDACNPGAQASCPIFATLSGPV
jgi:MerR family transcriptional regulator, mercuric resistance operon regulatory protein